MKAMTFLWPHLLWLLVAVPLLVVAYVLIQRRRRKGALRYASLALVKDALGPGPRLRRHIPPALMLAALTLALIGIARPHAVIVLPSQQRTIILTMDVSLSMRAADVEPNRISAAQAAAKGFIEELPRDVRIGIVSFGANASLVQPPTSNRDDLIAAIDRFQLQYGTATGSGLIVAMATLFPDEDIDIEAATFGGGFYPAPPGAETIDRAQRPKKAPTPRAPGTYPSAAIILLSDGRRTMGPDPLEIARMAADHGVRVFTVGFGTVNGGVVGFGSGWSAYLRLDEDTLKAVADLTRGQYFYAGTAADLRKVYQTLNAQLAMEKKPTEITAFFCAAAAVLCIAAGLLSVLWFRRIL
jgi:Ca-activated chloride channel family protein